MLRLDTRERRLAFAFATAAFLVHALTARGYGWFRDELYYVACGEHLAFGYVDHPPLVAWVARAVRLLGTDSPVPLRLVAALTAAGTVWVIGTMATRLGAKGYGVALACLSALVAPLLLVIDGYFSMNVFDLFFWALAARTSLRLLPRDSSRDLSRGGVEGEAEAEVTTRDWVLFGLLLGLGLENKLSVGFFMAGLALGIVGTRHRALLRTRGPWIAVALALALFAPNVIWIFATHRSTFEFMEHARNGKNAAMSPLAFLGEQVKQMHPLTAPVWLAGLGAALFAHRGRYRPLGVAYLFTLVFFMFGHGKPYYVGAAYPMLFAFGGAAIEGWLLSRPARAASLGVFAAGGVVVGVAMLPALPPETLIRYRAAIGIPRGSGEKGEDAPLGQRFADELGWDTLVAAVARARDQLPEDERADVGIFAGNYGEAAAIDVLGPRLGLPHAMSGHNAYWHWGPKGRPDGPYLVVGEADDEAELRAFCGEVTARAARTCADCMPHERDLVVWECRRPRAPIASIWPTLKHFE